MRWISRSEAHARTQWHQSDRLDRGAAHENEKWLRPEINAANKRSYENSQRRTRWDIDGRWRDEKRVKCGVSEKNKKTGQQIGRCVSIMSAGSMCGGAFGIRIHSANMYLIYWKKSNKWICTKATNIIGQTREHSKSVRVCASVFRSSPPYKCLHGIVCLFGHSVCVIIIIIIIVVMVAFLSCR